MQILEKILEEIEDRKSYHEELLFQRDDYEIQKTYCDEELNWIRDIISSHMNKKEKVTSAKIVSREIDGKTYYEIQFKEVGKDYYTVGYGSYKLDYVVCWLNEYFEFCGEANVVVGDTKDINTDWIPVEERLPEKNEHYLVQLSKRLLSEDWSDRAVVLYDVEKKGFMDHEKYIIAWQPLPEPYKAE